MVHWNSSPHPISDIRDWSEANRLELRPDFQRREVWSAVARIMLMDTILRRIPMPKIFLANTVRDGSTYRVVIDGQQRISAILDFLRDNFALNHPFTGKNKGKTFSELDPDTQDSFLSYQIDFNEAVKPTDEEVREVYARVNKYTVPLTKQELRRADFPGDFLKVSEELAGSDYFDKIGIFTPATRRRYGDVEYVSELLAAMIDGIQDEKTSLDDFYIKYSNWDAGQKKEIETRFLGVLQELRVLFSGGDIEISRSRFRQKADFYTLFLVIDEFVSQGLTVNHKDIKPLQEDLTILQDTIHPESDVEICSEYAIKCVSQANSASSRRWRYRFLKSILVGTYVGKSLAHVDPKIFEGRAQVVYRLKEGLSMADEYCYCPAPEPEFSCPVCEKEISGYFTDCVLAWPQSETVHQISNADWIHRSCVENRDDWLILERPNNDQSTLF